MWIGPGRRRCFSAERLKPVLLPVANHMVLKQVAGELGVVGPSPTTARQLRCSHNLLLPVGTKRHQDVTLS